MEFTPTGDVPDAPIVPNVRNEFGTLKTAIVSPFSAPEIYAQIGGLPVDEALRLMKDPASPSDLLEHFSFAKLLRDRNVRLCYPHPPNLPLTSETITGWVGPDIYCRDFLGVVDDHAILSKVISFRDENRVRYQSIFEKIPSAQRSMTDGTFTWGNALLHDDKILTGLEHMDYFSDIYPFTAPDRFSEELSNFQEKSSGIREIDLLLSHIGSKRELVKIPMNSNADLDCAIAPLPRLRRNAPRRALLQATEIHSDAETVLGSQFDECIFVQDPYETRACNILWLNPETPVLATEAIQTRRELSRLGYNPIPLPLESLKKRDTGTEFEGSYGGWRCMTGVLERANDYDFDS